MGSRELGSEALVISSLGDVEHLRSSPAQLWKLHGPIELRIPDLAQPERERLESRLNELATERSELAGKIDEDILVRFERLFASKGDAAIVALDHEVCTGCHMKVTTQTAHRVKNGKEIVSCEQCGRILYAA